MSHSGRGGHQTRRTLNLSTPSQSSSDNVPSPSPSSSSSLFGRAASFGSNPIQSNSGSPLEQAWKSVHDTLSTARRGQVISGGIARLIQSLSSAISDYEYDKLPSYASTTIISLTRQAISFHASDVSVLTSLCALVNATVGKDRISLSSSDLDELCSFCTKVTRFSLAPPSPPVAPSPSQPSSSTSPSLEQLRLESVLSLCGAVYENGSKLSQPTVDDVASLVCTLLSPSSPQEATPSTWECKRRTVNVAWGLVLKASTNPRLSQHYPRLYNALFLELKTCAQQLPKTPLSSLSPLAKCTIATMRALQQVISEGKSVHPHPQALSTLMPVIRSLSLFGTMTPICSQLPITVPSGSAASVFGSISMSASSSGSEPGTPQHGGSDSDSDGSAPTLGERESSRIRQWAVGMIVPLVRAVGSRQFYGLWTSASLLPDSSSIAPKPFSPTLTFALIHDPNIQVRAAAAAAIQSLLENSRIFLAQADDTKSRAGANAVSSFTPLSTTLASIIRELHLALVHALKKEKKSTSLVPIIKCLQVLMENTPYQRLTTVTPLSDILDRLHSFAFSSEKLVQTAAVFAMGSIFITGAFKPQITALICPDLAAEAPAPAVAAAAAASSSSSSSLSIASDSAKGEAGVLDTLLRLAIQQPLTPSGSPSAPFGARGATPRSASPSFASPRGAAAQASTSTSSRADALATLSKLAKSYPQCVSHAWPSVRDVLIDCLASSDSAVRLHALYVITELTHSSRSPLASGEDGNEMDEANDAPAAVSEGIGAVSVSMWQEIVGMIGCGTRPTKASAAAGAASIPAPAPGSSAASIPAPAPGSSAAPPSLSFGGISDPDSQVRAAAISTLAHLTPTVFSALRDWEQISLVTSVLGAGADESPLVRAASCRTLGILVTFPLLANDPLFIEDVACALEPILLNVDFIASAPGTPNNNPASAPTLAQQSQSGSMLTVRVRACWALANLAKAIRTHQFREEVEEECGEPEVEPEEQADDANTVMRLVKLSLASCSDNDKVVSNAVRAVGNFLSFLPQQSLEASSSFGDLPPSVDSKRPTVASLLARNSGSILSMGCHALNEALTSGSVKSRWNTCHAAGLAMTNKVFASLAHTSPAPACPCNQLVESMARALCTDSNLKVRVQAAAGLAFVPEQHSHRALDALLSTLENTPSPASFPEYKYVHQLTKQMRLSLVSLLSAPASSWTTEFKTLVYEHSLSIAKIIKDGITSSDIPLSKAEPVLASLKESNGPASDAELAALLLETLNIAQQQQTLPSSSGASSSSSS